MKLGWLSDIHLNFLETQAAHEFVASVSPIDVDAWALSGDIGEANSVIEFLRLLATLVPATTYFTLGNHDFYGSSLARVRREVGHVVAGSDRLVWLTEAEPQLLDGAVAVVGDEAWADARLGNALGTLVELTDFFAIEELSGLDRRALIRTLNALGDEAAARLAPKLDKAAASCRRVVVVTHVPPFREAAWHQGRPSHDDWLPWFSCHAVGEVLLQCARRNPTVDFLVLCGHTHGSGVCSPEPNVTVHTAAAEYGAPRVQGVFDLDSWPAFRSGRT